MKGKKVIGIVGGGQLGRMLPIAALNLGFKVVVVDPTENCPAAQVGAEQIVADLHDESALLNLAEKSDYITVEIEHLDTKTLAKIAKKGVPVNPSPSTISLIQDKLQQKRFLQKNNLPVADFEIVKTISVADKLYDQYSGRLILKARRNAYDGRGNFSIKTKSDLKTVINRQKGSGLYAEKLLDFDKELAVVVAKNSAGEVVPYPVVETIHQRSICIEVRAPAQLRSAVARHAVKLAVGTVNKLDGAGVFAIEMFLLKDNSIVINEIAPRVHNSGHYSLDACFISQFEQHIRAITNLPLGDARLITPSAVMINILGERNGPTMLKGLAKCLAVPDTAVHIYGKSPTKIDRKMGHITSIGKTVKQARSRAVTAREHLDI